MAELMRAVGYHRSLPISDPSSLVDLTLPVPEPTGHDLLVRVEAVSVNPADAKVRLSGDPDGGPKVLGYDAAGVVDRVGDQVTLFRPGDQVWYAGSVARPGTNAELHLVDERIVGPKPATLDFAEAAALPLTALTAWEALFDRLRLTADSRGSLLVLGAAGGVGAVLVQLARQLTSLEVVGTASRPESRRYVLDRGAHRVVDHHADLVAALPDGVDYVFSPHSAGMVDTFARIVRPFGAIVAIDEPPGLDLLPLKSKSIAWHWELMFTRPLYDPTSLAQHEILRQVADLVDKGVLHTTLTTRIDGIDAANLRRAHALVESGGTIGKIVLTRR
ncbi:zinc-binding alcohol dehydrogenase family protein [Micromonospora cathayae]|uniref:Zinc-type alcohol dehydrogenase-like protein n=1 Tax=Micromonospora cathayae TaxID=3028804 RepID=A0ABY7ZLJ4_9ACTN|nr:zinc-binding alcohol dehydrogenase family protein [Micromonospora sp. HUAS 3]WDZ82844.1 zinc-binding alcohol dehydrogenase family protein [Micromonospora sp. HUAS 3]